MSLPNHGFEPSRIDLDVFIARWLPGLERDGLFVGLNWSGKLAVGFDMTPKEVLARLKARVGCNGDEEGLAETRGLFDI